MTGTRKKLLRFVLGASIAYVLGGVLLYFIQGLLLFHPVKLERNHRFTFDHPHEERNLAVGGDNLNFVRFLAPAPRRGIVLYFHGNKQNIERYASFMPMFTARGYEVWMMDYPGFGKTTGKLTEQRLYEDAALLYQQAAAEVGAGALIVYGKSLGTGVAAQLAATHPCRLLLLETPYYSLPAVARSRFPIYPADHLLRYSFPTHLYLPRVRAPITMFHGTNDSVIPYEQSQKLSEENPRAKLILFEGGKHNDLPNFPLFQRTLDSLLQGAGVLPQRR